MRLCPFASCIKNSAPLCPPLIAPILGIIPPMTAWNNIIGHEWAVQLLHGAIVHDRVGHAYLITGPAHIGKTTLARTFAQALNCEAPDPAQRPCGLCRPCKLITANRHPDVRLLEPEISGRGKPTIKIDQIRALQQGLSLAAYEARYKVAILTQFDAANPNAANAFLKTLEEPPANVILLLTAGDADTLLATIVSRCRTVGLRPLASDQIAQSLTTRWHVPDDRAELLAHLADGRLGWAVMAHQTPELLTVRQQQLDALQKALAGRRIARFALADELTRKPELLPDVLRGWLSWWRDLLILAQFERATVSPPSYSLTNIDRQAELRELARRWPAEAILHSLTQTNQALWQLDHNANTRLVLENLLLAYPFP